MFTNNQKPYFRSEHTKYQPRIYVKKRQKTIEQVKSFNYLGNISYERELYIEKKKN
jgi:excinuclease UvrABC helicase subunit UvrB